MSGWASVGSGLPRDVGHPSLSEGQKSINLEIRQPKGGPMESNQINVIMIWVKTLNIDWKIATHTKHSRTWSYIVALGLWCSFFLPELFPRTLRPSRLQPVASRMPYMVLPGVSIPACQHWGNAFQVTESPDWCDENVLEYLRLHKDQEELEIYQFETQLFSEVVNLGPFSAKTMQKSKY
jgi:hypothetical protein